MSETRIRRSNHSLSTEVIKVKNAILHFYAAVHPGKSVGPVLCDIQTTKSKVNVELSVGAAALSRLRAMLQQSREDVAVEECHCRLEQKAAARLNGAVPGEGRFGCKRRRKVES
ncbi:hypothetical protein AV530_014977 [Patagioenas fasciata monilis]|uniref:Uncharacterized protein n=1 Tax=Patagioenas fasciata monilis TaxID=372326 RepID=A0A1V4K0N5_PATFA|nr:hypothetical protein AV530_014977 [Patagioenas fasciata monilis]